MKALILIHPDFSKTRLLAMAEEVPGAWTGIRIAGYLLMLSGWSAAKVADLFGISRVNTSKWCHKANTVGLCAIHDKLRPGRPSQFDKKKLKLLNNALSNSPKDSGIQRTRWDGKVVVEYLERYLGLTIHVRHAQRLIRKLGYSLRQPVYRYVQASNEGVAEYRRTIKKTSIRSRRSVEKTDSVR
jgi:transposase